MEKKSLSYKKEIATISILAVLAIGFFVLFPSEQGSLNTPPDTTSYSADSTSITAAESVPSETTEYYNQSITEETTQPQGDYYRVTVGYGNRLSLRSEPNENSAKLDSIDNGERLFVTEVRDDWGIQLITEYRVGFVCLNMEIPIVL